MSLVHVKSSRCILGTIPPFAFSEEANSINKESADTMMDLEFSRQLAELPTSLGGMEWEDSETISFAEKGKSETMNNESLEIMMDPSHELRTFKEQQIKEAYRMEQMDLEKKYGTDGGMLKLVCHETNAGLDKCVDRLDHGDEIHKQMRIWMECGIMEITARPFICARGSCRRMGVMVCVMTRTCYGY